MYYIYTHILILDVSECDDDTDVIIRVQYLYYAFLIEINCRRKVMSADMK